MLLYLAKLLSVIPVFIFLGSMMPEGASWYEVLSSGFVAGMIASHWFNGME
jgi:hypothetical protein